MLNKTDLGYLFRDFTTIGKAEKGGISFLPEDTVYKWAPDRYNFYMQVIDEATNPNSNIIDAVLSIETKTRRNREKLKENVKSIANIVGYMDSRTGDPAEVVKSTNSKLKENIISSKWTLSELDQRGGAPKYLRDINQLIEDTQNNDNEAKKVIRMYENDPILSPSNAALTTMDRVIFIATTFMIRAVALFIVQWSLNTRMISDFNQGFLMYIGIYIAIFILWFLLVNTSGTQLFFKMLFYYINLDGGESMKQVVIRLAIHFFIFLVLLPVPFIVKDTTRENLFSPGEISSDNIYQERIKNFRYISQFTFFIWILTSVIAFATP